MPSWRGSMRGSRRLVGIRFPLVMVTAFFCSGALRTATASPAQSIIDSTDKDDLQLIAALNIVIPRIMTAYQVPGLNIAMAREGRMMWQGAYGYADAKSHRPMTVDTVFHSGSLAKPYAGIAVMQLVEQGRLKLDEPINRYLPFEVRNSMGGPAITTRHLLTHTSGLGNSATDAMSYLCDDPRAIQPLERRLRGVFSSHSTDPTSALSIWTEPTGMRWQYSNLGAALLGLIVERVNAEHLSYSAYVQRYIMDRVGMRYAQIPLAQTRGLTRRDIWKRLSVGYQTMGEAWIPNAQVCFGSFPCGGSFATPADYLRVLIATLQGGHFNGVQLLSQDSVDQMLTPASYSPQANSPISISQDDKPPSEAQGLIWQLRDWPSATRAFHHGGGHMYGWRTMAVAYPTFDTAFVVAVNRWNSLNDSQPEIDALTSFIDMWLKSPATLRTPAMAQSWQIHAPLQVDVLPEIQNIRWKASYLRGLLYAES